MNEDATTPISQIIDTAMAAVVVELVQYPWDVDNKLVIFVLCGSKCILFECYHGTAGINISLLTNGFCINLASLHTYLQY